jgi:hypothetical protein
LSDPAIALCTFEAYEEDKNDQVAADLDQLWTEFYKAVYSLPPEEPDVMGWYRQISDNLNHRATSTRPGCMDQRLYTMDRIGDQVLQHYAAHSPDEGIQLALMGYMSNEAFQKILAGYTMQKIDQAQIHSFLPAPRNGGQVMKAMTSYLDNDDMFIPVAQLPDD